MPSANQRLKNIPLSTLLFGACCVLISLWLAACSNDSQAPADQVSDNQSTDKPITTDSAPSETSAMPAIVPIQTFEGNTLNVLDISERNKEGRNGIAVMFSHALDVGQNLQPYFEIKNEEGDLIDGAWIVDDTGKTAWFTHTEPRTSYDVTIVAGLPALEGMTLLKEDNTKLTTRALSPSISFETHGAILPLGYASGLPIVTIDIDQIDIDFFRIENKHLATFFEETRYGGRSGWNAQRLKQLGKLAFSSRFELDAPIHTRTALDIDLSGFQELEEPGLYLAVMRQAGEYNQRQLTWFSITNIGMHLRQYNGLWHVHLASLTTGAPLSGVTVKALDAKSGILFERKSDENGLVQLQSRDQEIRALVAQTDKQYTSLNLRQPALDLSEFNLGSRPFKPLELFLYGPRDLYRPGEKFLIRGLLRDQDGKNIQAKDTQSPPLEAHFISPNQSTRHAYLWHSSHTGYYEYEWSIPSDAKTGLWTLRVTLPNQEHQNITFHVEDFLPERLKLDIANAAPKTVLRPGQTLKVPVEAAYLYGAPADGNRLSTLLNVRAWRTPLDTFKEYHFGDIKEQNYDPLIELKDRQLSKEGKTDVTIDNVWQNAKSPLRLSMTASVYEAGGRAVNRSHPILYWPYDHAIGIRPHFGETNPRSDSIVKFDLVNVDHQGDPAENTKISLNLIKEDRQYFWEFNDHRGWGWNWNEKEFVVEQKIIELNKAENTTIDFPVEWGHYRVEARNQSTQQMTSVRFYAGNNWYSDWQNSKDAAPRPDKISLALDQLSYKPGDIAVLNILPPAAGDVLVVVESDKPLWSQKISVPQQGLDLNIPIDPSWQQHNIYVSAMLIQPTGQNVTITPKRSLGLLHLPLNRSERELQLSLKAPERALPLQTLPLDIQVDNTELNQAIFVNVFAVDVGILNITDYKTPDPFAFFFEQRRYGVDMKDIYAGIIEPNNYAKARFQFGGDRDLSRGGAAPRSDVRIVSLHSGLVETDASGKAIIPMTLPDFNGRLRLMAIAHSPNRFGQQTKEITLASDLIVDLSMPRFLATDDTSSVALDLRNMTEAKQKVDIEISVSGAGKLANTSELKQTLSLKKQGKHTLTFDVLATGVRGQVLITATTKIGQQKAQMRSWRIGVRPAYPAVSRQQSAVLGQGETFTLDQKLLNKLRLSTTVARVQVSPAVDLRIGDQLHNLLQYPYGCLEQTTSRALPLLYANEQAQKQFQIKPVEEAKRQEHIRSAIDRVIGFQKANGSFGLWDSTSQEEHWLTAYTTFFLLQAREQGFQIPEKALNRALVRLENYLQRSGKFSGQRWSNDARHYAFATKAFAAYVLSGIKRAPLGTLRTLHKNDMNHAKSGLPQLLLSVALRNMGDTSLAEKTRKTALSQIPEHLDNSANTYWGDYGSGLRDVSTMIYLLLKHDLDKKAAATLAVKLRDSVTQRRWLSTQEQAMLFMAGLQLQALKQDSWVAQWVIGNQKETFKKETFTNESLSAKTFNNDELTDLIAVQSDAAAPLYVSASISGYGLSAPQASSKGLNIQRMWYDLDGKALTPQKIKTGEAFIVRLVVDAEQNTPDALIVDLLPAGFELENQNIGESLDLQALRVDDKPLADWLKQTEVKHQAYRDDRYTAAINLRAGREANVFYLVRAVTPGTFTVPSPMVEDMYRPYLRAVGKSIPNIQIKHP